MKAPQRLIRRKAPRNNTAVVRAGGQTRSDQPVGGTRTGGFAAPNQIAVPPARRRSGHQR